MSFKQVHPGGYFWSLDRIDREKAIRRLATEVPQLVVITRTDVIAHELAQRLGLSGMPVVVGTTGSGSGAMRAFQTDGVSALVASDGYLRQQQPIEASLVVHARIAFSSKDYNRRLAAVVAPVHVSVVVPEDEKPARVLIDHLHDREVIEFNDDEAISTVIDLTTHRDPAKTRPKRRFPLPR